MSHTDSHLEFDRSTHRLLKIQADDTIEIVRLTPLEGKLVEHMFTKNRLDGGRSVVCPYPELTAAVWPDREYEDARPFLNGLVFELRQKIETNASAPRLLTTIPGEGYALDVRPFSAVRRVSPFVSGLPILEPARFFGRTREVGLLFGLWTHRPLQSAMIVGPRRSGKTSLLCYLKALPRTPPSGLRPDQAPCPLSSTASGRDGHAAGAYRMAFLSFQDPRTRTVPQVLGEILHAFGLRPAEPCPEDTFVDCIMSHLDAPSIVLMDEVDRGLQRPELRDLWGTLRSAASHHPRQLLAFALACAQVPPVAEDSSAESPLLNIVNDCVDLGPLTPAEAEALIASAPRPFPDDDVAWILERSGRWPALLQIFCDTRWRALERDEGSGEWKAEALQRARRLQHLMSG